MSSVFCRAVWNGTDELRLRRMDLLVPDLKLEAHFDVYQSFSCTVTIAWDLSPFPHTNSQDPNGRTNDWSTEVWCNVAGEKDVFHVLIPPQRTIDDLKEVIFTVIGGPQGYLQDDVTL